MFEILGRKYTLAASRSAPWWVTLSMHALLRLEKDGRDRWTPTRYITLTARRRQLHNANDDDDDDDNYNLSVSLSLCLSQGSNVPSCGPSAVAELLVWLPAVLCLSVYSSSSSVLLFNRPRSDGWPHHGRTYSIHLCPLSLWLTLPPGVLSTYWCCPSRPCVVFFTCVHLPLFLALSLSPGNSLLFLRCDRSMLTSLRWQSLTVPLYSSFVKNPLICFLSCPLNSQNLSQTFQLRGVKTCFFILSECPGFTVVRCYMPH